MKEKILTIKINCCNQCPYWDEERVYTGDSFENVFKWVCKKHNRKKIAIVETFDKNPKIPDWC